MKKKYTKEQIKAIETLLIDLDELENKPRRLYHALEEFAFAFDKHHCVPSIREAQDVMYRHINEGDYYAELFRSLREFKIDEWKWQSEKPTDDIEISNIAIKGAEGFVKKHITRLCERRF